MPTIVTTGAVTVTEPKTVVLCQNRGEPKPRFFWSYAVFLIAQSCIHHAHVVFSFYKGIVPLWSRQIPYTMMKFACFERTIEALYKYVVPKPRSQCTKPEQLVVTFIAGYIGLF